MDALRVLVLHGWQGSGPGHWQRWLASELRAGGHHVGFPELPECDVPCPDQWGASLHAELEALATAPGGGERIEASVGHDDLADSLYVAGAPWRPRGGAL